MCLVQNGHGQGLSLLFYSQHPSHRDTSGAKVAFQTLGAITNDNWPTQQLEQLLLDACIDIGRTAWHRIQHLKKRYLECAAILEKQFQVEWCANNFFYTIEGYGPIDVQFVVTLIKRKPHKKDSPTHGLGLMRCTLRVGQFRK